MKTADRSVLKGSVLAGIRVMTPAKHVERCCREVVDTRSQSLDGNAGKLVKNRVLLATAMLKGTTTTWILGYRDVIH